MKDNKDPSEIAHNVRSRILNYAISIEMLLQDFIRDYFVKEDSKKLKFAELIVGKEFFTFEQKIRVFGKIIEELKNVKIINPIKGEYDLTSNRKELLKKLRYIREIRNVIAHIHPFRDAGTNAIGIIYRPNKKSKEIMLDEVFAKEFFDKYLEVDDILRDLSNELFKK